MAGSGVYTSYNSSKEWHQTKGDYNDNVIVPKSILIDTADAIRLKRDGNTSIETDTSPSDNTEFIRGSNGIIPANFATEIGNLVMGSSLTDIQNIATTERYSSKLRLLQWKGDIRKIAFIAYMCNKTSNTSTFHEGYIFIPSMLSQDFTYG